MMTKLPFLKSRRLPKIATDQPDPKLVNGSTTDHLEAHCFGELNESMKTKNVKKFRAALEALVMDCFDFDGDEHAA